jgi:hypothetical protein
LQAAAAVISNQVSQDGLLKAFVAANPLRMKFAEFAPQLWPEIEYFLQRNASNLPPDREQRFNFGPLTESEEQRNERINREFQNSNDPTWHDERRLGQFATSWLSGKLDEAEALVQKMNDQVARSQMMDLLAFARVREALKAGDTSTARS